MEYKAKVSEAKNWAATVSEGKAGQSRVFEPSEEQILRSQSLTNRRIFQGKAAEAVVHEAEQHTAIVYEGYDAATGMAKLTDAKGNISYAAPITNGAVSKGEIIRARHGSLMTYDAMPIIKKPLTPKKQKPKSKETAEAAILFVVPSIRYKHALWFHGLFPHFNIGNTFEQHTTENITIDSDEIIINDTFSLEIGHGGELDTLKIFYVPKTVDDAFASRQNRAITFICPSEAEISIDFSFTPGGGVIGTGCGISVDRHVGDRLVYYESGFPKMAEIDPDCDAYSSGTSVSYATTVGSGYHFISIRGVYNWEYSVKGNSAADILYTENVTGSISISIKTITKSLFYLQKGDKVFRLGEIETSRKDYRPYLSNLGFQQIVHLKFRDYFGETPNQEVYQYLLDETGIIAQSVFQKTEQSEDPIAAIEGDWQSASTSSYLPSPPTGNPCVDDILTDRASTNIYNSNLLICNLEYQSDGNKPLANLIKEQPINARVTVKTYDTEDGSCNITNTKTVKARLPKLNPDVSDRLQPIPDTHWENINPGIPISVLAVSATYKKK